MNQFNETKLCKHCKTEIPKDAKVCPNCRKKQGSFLKGLAVVFVVMMIFGACSSGEEDNTNNPPVSQEKGVTDTTNESTAEKEPDVPTEYKSALKKAKSYSDMMHMSKQGIYDQLTSEYGEQFSAEAAQYAIDNLQADWNANALEKAKDYQEQMSMSPEAIRDQLTSEYGEKFTQEEADYAIANLN